MHILGKEGSDFQLTVNCSARTVKWKQTDTGFTDITVEVKCGNDTPEV